MSMRDVQCKICGSAMQVSSDAKSGVCFKCVLEGRFVPSAKNVEGPKVVVSEDTEKAQAPVVEATTSVKEKPVENVPDKASKQKRGERSSRIVTLVKEGKTNKEAIEILKAEFPLVDVVDMRNLLYVVRNRLKKAAK